MRTLDDGHVKSLLKTKIVATVGRERSGPEAGRDDEVFDPNGDPVMGVLPHDDLLSWLVRAGVDVIRLNMSFASDQEPYGAVEKQIMEWVAANRDGLARHVAVLGDLPGPKIRLRVREAVRVKLGETFTLNFTSENPDGEREAAVLVNDQAFATIASVNKMRLEDYLRRSRDKGQEIVFSIGDGKVILKAAEVVKGQPGVVSCAVLKGGEVRNKQGVTIRRADIMVDRFLNQDRQALRHLLDHGAGVVSFVAVSFVNRAEDILDVKREIEKQLEVKYGPDAGRYAPAIVAKIETRLAWENLDHILDVSDCVMVARGDLGLQLNPQEVPAIQKEIIRRCNLRGKPVITATQMLDSMESSMEPTRAEANDVFNAIQDGTDAVMLSGETSIGKYPAQAVAMMTQIAEQAENFFFGKHSGRLYKGRLQDISRDSEESSIKTTARLKESKTYWADKATMARIPAEERREYQWRGELYDEKISRSEKQTTTDSISESACLLSAEKGYSAIVAPTTSGRTARMIARFRPRVPVIGVAHDEENARKLIISFGVYPLSIGEGQEGVEEVFQQACGAALKPGYVPWDEEFQLLKDGDQVVATSGTPLKEIGTTNLIQIRKV
jgi:pyruvate kinase